MCCFLVFYLLVETNFEDFDYFFIWKEGSENVINLTFSYVLRAEVVGSSQVFFEIWSNSSYSMACARDAPFAPSVPSLPLDPDLCPGA